MSQAIRKDVGLNLPLEVKVTTVANELCERVLISHV